MSHALPPRVHSSPVSRVCVAVPAESLRRRQLTSMLTSKVTYAQCSSDVGAAASVRMTTMPSCERCELSGAPAPSAGKSP